MNYASVVFVGFVSVAAVWYLIWGKKNYIGPILDASEDDTIDAMYASQMADERNQGMGNYKGNDKPVSLSNVK